MPLRMPGWWRVAPDSILATSLRRGQPAWSEAIHILWSVWVFVVPTFTPRGYDLQWVLITLLSYPLFVAAYAAVLTLPRRRVAWPALGMIALTFVLLPWYAAGMSYFVFGCVFLGIAAWRSVFGYFGVLVLLNLLFFAWARVLGYPWSAFLWMPIASLVPGLLVYVERVKQARDVALALSHDEVRRLAALAERERIGRDLHDLLGHTLSMVALKADLASKLVERDPAAARREIDEVSGVARDALAQVRQAVSGIRAAGLAAELASARLLLETDGVAFDYALDDGIAASALPETIETALAMTLREAVTNVQRHARASAVHAAFARDGDTVRLVVRDDGRGGAIVPGNGLSGMRERLAALGGRLRVDGDGRGTRVDARIPLQPAS